MIFFFYCSFFFFNDTATTEIYTRKDTLSLHDALPICRFVHEKIECGLPCWASTLTRSEEHTSELQSPFLISYAVFCLKKKNNIHLPANANLYFLHEHPKPPGLNE